MSHIGRIRQIEKVTRKYEYASVADPEHVALVEEKINEITINKLIGKYKWQPEDNYWWTEWMKIHPDAFSQESLERLDAKQILLSFKQKGEQMFGKADDR